jgi:FkbM family methyltransferase
MYENIIDLIQRNELEKALEEIKNIEENKWEKYNLSGLIYFYKNELEKAKTMYEKGLKIEPINSDLLYNYAHILISMGKEIEAWKYLMRIHEKDWAVYDILGDIEFKNRSKASAIKFYKKAYDLNQTEEMAKKLLEKRKAIKKNEKIAFFCLPGLETFIKPIAEELTYEYDVRLIISKDANEITEAIKWADIVWLEWANDLAIFATNKVPEIANKKVICRLHGYEIFSKFPEKINWELVDKLIFVNEHKKELFKEIYPKVNVEKIVIKNGIDLDKFTFKIRKKNHNLLIMGNINYRKGFETLLLSFQHLLETDNKYKLYIKGIFQDLRYRDYILNIIKEMKIENNIIFIDQYIDDIDSWGERFGYILSTSIEESFHYTIGEFMSKGIKPVINSWPSARETWPNECIFTTIDQFKEKILEDKYDSNFYRRFIEDKYSLEEQVYEVEKIVTQQKSKSKANHIFSFDYNNKKIYFYLPFLSDHIQKAIYLNKNFYEVHMLEDTKNRIRKNAVIVDVGANIGNHTIFYAKICQAKKVYSFEPQSEIFDILTKNIKLNNVNNTVVPYKMGVGKEHSFGYIDVIDSYNFGSSRIVNLNNQKGEIEIDSLDSLIFNFEEKIDLIKIDVEGMEMDVLLGAEKIIQQYKPLIYIEAKENKEFDEINFFLRNFNYKPIKKFNYTPTYLFINE